MTDEILDDDRMYDVIIDIHDAFNNSPIFTYSELSEITIKNGLFVVFEDGELFEGMKRIVYVGKNIANGRLKQRIKDIFGSTNKDGAILRKYIGAAILGKNKDRYHDVWLKASYNAEKRAKLGAKYDAQKEKELESAVSDYMHKHMSVATVYIPNLNDRNNLQNHLVGTLREVYGYEAASSNWLGNNIEESRIQEVGLWQLGSIYSPLLSEKDVSFLLEQFNYSEGENPERTLYEQRESFRRSSSGYSANTSRSVPASKARNPQAEDELVEDITAYMNEE